MKDRWLIRGPSYTTCNCASGCPCQFGSPTTNGFCTAVAAGTVSEGYWNDVRLEGLHYVVLVAWPGEIAQGNGRQQLIIDERAKPAQRDALVKILRGESTAPGATHWSVFASTTSEFLDPIYAPIECAFDVEQRTARVRVPGLVESDGTPMLNAFDGSPVRAGIGLPNGFEFTYAEVASGTTRSRGAIELDLSKTHAHLFEMALNQDGVIR
jgi:hypothetical protein